MGLLVWMMQTERWSLSCGDESVRRSVYIPFNLKFGFEFSSKNCPKINNQTFGHSENQKNENKRETMKTNTNLLHSWKCCKIYKIRCKNVQTEFHSIIFPSEIGERFALQHKRMLLFRAFARYINILLLVFFFVAPHSTASPSRNMKS